jgi:hypothetical protein
VKRPFFALLLSAIAVPLAAQTTEYGPLALTLPASARTLGMGNVGVTGRDDDVIFYNPAQLMVARGTSMSIARSSEVARGGTMSTVLRLGPGGVGFGVNYLEFQTAGLIYPVTRDEVLDRNLSRGSSILGSVGYAQVVRKFRVGVSANYASDAVDLQRYTGVYGDVGIGRDFGRYSTGLAVQHIGRSIDRGADDIKAPMQATLGASTSRALGPLDGVATAAVIANQEQVSGAGGIELGWSWISGYSIAGRAGIHQPNEAGVADYTTGFGFTADRLTIDLAAEFLKGGRASYRAGLRIR